VLSCLIILVLVTVSVNSDPTKGASLPDKVLLEVVGRLQQAFTGSARAVESVWRGYFYLVNQHEENQRLETTVGLLRSQINDLKEAKLANQRLANILKFKAGRDFPYVGADVVSWNPNSWFKTITIDRGSQDGVASGMPVISHQGMVGRVVEVSPGYSRVLLIIDYNSSVDAYVQRSRVRGILAGRSERKCIFKYALKNDDVQRGDVIVSSGMSGAFPKGLPLGRVSRVKATGQDIFLEIDVTPAADFDHLEEVLVVLTKQLPY
jgi:rod shape-determining protein MreC